MEPGEETERPASTEISLLSKFKQTAKWSHHGANPAEVLRQEIWDVASPGDTTTRIYNSNPTEMTICTFLLTARPGLRLL